MNNPLKDYKKAFDFILNKIRKGENFAFTRFSDGELDILRNRHCCLYNNSFRTGDHEGHGVYTIEEIKEFIPSEHQFVREALMEAYAHNQDNYFKGISTSTDVHPQQKVSPFEWMIDFHKGDHPSLTFCNLLINSNYPRFVNEMIPEFMKKDIIYVVNENANLKKLPFNVKKAFTIGSNCPVRDFDLPEKIIKYIEDNNINNHIILCAAATLSNFVIHKCFLHNANNTFLDVGSCLNPLLDLEGWVYTRGYLTSFWLGSNSHYGKQVDYWE